MSFLAPDARRLRLKARWRRFQMGWARTPANLRGALWLLASAVLHTAMITLVKYLGTRLDPFQVAFFRALFGLMVILPFLMRSIGGGFRTHFPLLQLTRGVVGSSAMLLGFYAITHLPLADAQAISFARALFVAPLAVLILGEIVGARRWAATAVGFLGVVIMLRPTGTVDPAALVALAAAALVGLAVILVKIVSQKDQPVTLMFYSGVVGSCVAAIPAALNWQTPTLGELALLVLMGAVGASAHNCFIRAYATGEATALAPIDYTRLIFAALVGFLMFGDIPDLWAITGAVIIAGSTLYIVRREAQVARAAADSAPDSDLPLRAATDSQCDVDESVERGKRG